MCATKEKHSEMHFVHSVFILYIFPDIIMN